MWDPHEDPAWHATFLLLGVSMLVALCGSERAALFPLFCASLHGFIFVRAVQNNKNKDRIEILAWQRAAPGPGNFTSGRAVLARGWETVECPICFDPLDLPGESVVAIRNHHPACRVSVARGGAHRTCIEKWYAVSPFRCPACSGRAESYIACEKTPLQESITGTLR